MGNVETGAKVVLWNENRTPVQIWTAQVSGKISSVTFPGMVLDVKGEIRNAMFYKQIRHFQTHKTFFYIKVQY